MPRKKRIEIPGALHHIMTRGLDGLSLFIADNDRIHFLELLTKNIRKINCRCYAWALMPNHYHLLLRPVGKTLGLCMRRLNSSYARYYNKKYKRRGFLFQDRYKSIATQEFNYFKELIKYIHLNPLRAGIVHSIQELDTYLWTSHYDIVNEIRFNWYLKHEVLRRFGNNKLDAFTKYYTFLKENEYSKDFPIEIRKDSEECLEDERVAGDPEFVRSALLQDKNYQIRKRMLISNGVTIEEVKRKVCNYFKINQTELNRVGKNSILKNARDIIFYYCYIDLGYSLSTIGNHFKLSSSAVSYGVEKGSKFIKSKGLNSII